MIEFPSSQDLYPMSFGWLSLPLRMISKCLLSLNLLWLFYLLRIFIGPTLIFTLDFLCLWPTKSGMDALENMIHSQKLIFPRASVLPESKLSVNSYTLTMLILFYFWFRVLKKSSLLPCIKFNRVSGRSASFWLASITMYPTMRNLILTASPQSLPSIQVHGCHPSLCK